MIRPDKTLGLPSRSQLLLFDALERIFRKLFLKKKSVGVKLSSKFSQHAKSKVFSEYDNQQLLSARKLS